MKRFLVHVACAAAAVFALGVAAPTLADCGNCTECPKRKAAASADSKAPGKAEKKDAKPAEKGAPATPAAAPAGEKKAEAATKCECEKGGKGCICKMGECTCANCAAKLAAAEKPTGEKPKCTCAGGKDCGCKKTEKGECSCKHEAPRAT
jgi:hypothetical protein